MKGYHDAFYPPPRSPTPPPGSRSPSRARVSLSPAPTDEGLVHTVEADSHSRRSSEPLFQEAEDVDPDMVDMMALEEMEREEAAAAANGGNNGDGGDEPPILEEEDEWE